MCAKSEPKKKHFKKKRAISLHTPHPQDKRLPVLWHILF